MGTMRDMPGMNQMPGMGTISPMASGLQPGSFPTLLAVGGLFLISWMLMTAAMMLPSALSMVDTFCQLTSTRPGAPARIASFVLGYLLAWTGVGLVASLVSLWPWTGISRGMWLIPHQGMLAGGALVLAGLYQFTPLKGHCLRKCRAPLSFLMHHWGEGRAGALRMGSRHGLYCIGCCWALMLLMLVVGMAQLGWMVGLALVMFAEKVMRRGVVIGYGVGILFVLWGTVITIAAAGIAPA
jgi:predicted metal-binding membrane protein